MPTMPLDEFSAAIINAGWWFFIDVTFPLGYRISQYHNESGAVKTDAPNSFIWDILKTFKQK